MERASLLAGVSMQALADMCHTQCPSQLLRAKGWLGQTLERFLGADAGSLALPDFAKLGVELKTLPLTSQGQPKESTYVTYAPIPFEEKAWTESTVYKKLKHVLWVPYLADGPIAQRIIAKPFLFEMTAHISHILEQDWIELTEKLKLQQFDDLNGSLGRFLHLRPKAADSKTFIKVINMDGELKNIVPKGFYLRADFTKMLLQQTF